MILLPIITFPTHNAPGILRSETFGGLFTVPLQVTVFPAIKALDILISDTFNNGYCGSWLVTQCGIKGICSFVILWRRKTTEKIREESEESRKTS